MDQKEKLNALLRVPEGSNYSPFDTLRHGPTTISGPSFNAAIDRYVEFKSMGIQSLNFKHIPLIRLKSLARYAGITSMHKILRMQEDRRIATLMAFVYVFERTALDDALDVFDLLFTQIIMEAKKIHRQKRLRSLKDLDKSALLLADACAIILKETSNDDDLRETIFAAVSQENIAQSITTINELSCLSNHKFQDEMVEQYGRVRRFLPRLLDKLDFKAASAGEEMLEALNYLRKLEGSRKKNIENVPLDIIPKSWERLVFDQDKQVNKRAYTLCVLDKLQDTLRRRDIYVESSDRWGDPREKLLSGKDWTTNKLKICRTLGHPLGVDEAIKSLTDTLERAYQQAEANFSKNGDVRIELVDEKPTLTITNLDKLDELPSLIKLRQQVADFLPPIDLTELLLEIHAHTGFADEFTHISESNSRADDLAVSICAVLLSEACNIGIDPFIKHNNPALTRHRLNWVKQNYMRAETLTAANSQLVDYHMTIPLSQAWGGGEVASADGMRFVTSVKTINSGPIDFQKINFRTNKNDRGETGL